MAPESTKNLSKLSNEELLQEFQTMQDVSLFSILYQRYIPYVYGVCLKYLENRVVAQDAVIDIFELVLIKLPDYEDFNFKRWLHIVVKGHCLQIIEKEKKNAFVKIEEGVMENDSFFGPIDNPQTKEELDALSYCITTLPEEQRKSIHYFYIENKSYADIVKMTGFALNLVKSYIQNGRSNLKNCIVKKLNISN
ncbi:MAG: sigma-70 family RNA polymerase sigma factor [Bacteroidales bacterium]|jgi:RNA polymerase sigma-70 factor (ECF subfamily)|nr:sigma-70 family RNA polymerase sigma factor [Bacteroidales bacterium]